MTDWLDYKGGIMSAPYSDEPTGYEKYAERTHRLMRPQPGQLIQAISWCGHRVHEVPGRGDVNCPECLELIAESITSSSPSPTGR